MSLSGSDHIEHERTLQQAGHNARLQRLQTTIEGLTREIDLQNDLLLDKMLDLYVAGQLAGTELAPLCEELVSLQQELEQAQKELSRFGGGSSQPQASTPPPISSPYPSTPSGGSEPTVYTPLPGDYAANAASSTPLPYPAMPVGNSEATAYLSTPIGNSNPTSYLPTPIGNSNPTAYLSDPATPLGNDALTSYPSVPPEYQQAYNASEVTAPPPPGLENIPVSAVEAIAITTFHPTPHQLPATDPNLLNNPYENVPQTPYPPASAELAQQPANTPLPIPNTPVPQANVQASTGTGPQGGAMTPPPPVGHTAQNEEEDGGI